MVYYRKSAFKRRILSFLFVLVSLMSVVGMVSTTAIDYVAMDNYIDTAAKVQTVALSMKRCLDTWEVKSNNISTENMKKGAFFYDGSSDDDIVVGFWLEKLVRDGNIFTSGNDGGELDYCYITNSGNEDNIVVSVPELFAQYVLGDRTKYMSEIVCDNIKKSEDDGRFTFAAFVKDGASIYPTNDCNSADEFTIRLKLNDKGEIEKTRTQFVRELFQRYYDDYVDKHPENRYLAKWDSLDSFWVMSGAKPYDGSPTDLEAMLEYVMNVISSPTTGGIRYNIIYNDLTSGCGPDSDTGRTSVKIKDVSLDYNGGTFGKIIEREIYLNPKYKELDGYNIINSDDGEITCETMVSVLDKNVANYAASLLYDLGSQCKIELSSVIAEKLSEYRAIANDANASAGDKQKAIEYINGWQDYESKPNEKFIEQTEQGGWICNTNAGANVEIVVTEPDDPTEGGDYEQDACYSGAGVLGWILCPVVNAVSDLGKDAYDWIESNFLQIKASIFSDADNGVESVWSQIRSFANIGFIILFLVVIVSQLTGVGIDNYGIKRILPKLVICAILINLSYILCKVAIDVSNIVGNNLDNFFAGMGPDLQKLSNEYKPSGAQSFVTFGVGAVAIAVFMVLSQGGIGAILMLVMAIIAAVLAILTLFVILIIRQAGVVICVIVAPLAILCYVLPNTEKLYKKWLDLFKSLLVVYPICGLVIGVGSLLSRVFGKIAVDSGEGSLGMGFALAAMLVEVLPFFFIPKLLKGSLAAMGNIGAKVSGLSRGLSKGAGNKIKGSDAMKASKQRAFDNKVMRKAGINRKTGELNRRGQLKARFAGSALGRVTGYERLQASRNEAAGKVRKANIAAGAALTTAIATSDMVKKGQNPQEYYKDALDKAAKSGNMTAYESAIEAAVTSGQLKDKDIAKMVRETSGQFHKTVSDAGVRGNFYRKLGAKYGNGFMATDVEARTWLQMSGQLGTTGGGYIDYDISDSRVNAGDYARGVYFGLPTGTGKRGVSTSDVKASDIQKLSGGNMAAMISAGVIDSGLAKDALSMGGLSNDKKIMLGALAAAQDSGGSLTLSSEALKANAEALANNTTITYEVGGTSRTVTPAQALTNLGATQEQVAIWTAPPSQNVNIRQDGKQVNPVRVTLDGSRDTAYGGGYSDDTSASD